MKSVKVFIFIIAVSAVMIMTSCSGGGGAFDWLVGMVYDSQGLPIPDITVLVNGGNTGVSTDVRGTFSLDSSYFQKGIDSQNRVSIMTGGVVLDTREIVPSQNRHMVFQYQKADGPTGAVVGYVYDAYSAFPLPNTSLILFNPNLGLFRSLSGNDGYFSFRDVPSGIYRITARQEGYHVGIAMVDVAPGDETYQGMLLQPKNKAPFSEGVIVRGQIVDENTGWGVSDVNVTMTVETGFMGFVGPWEGDGTAPAPGEPSMGRSDGSESMAPPPWRYDPQYQETTTQSDGYFEFTEPAIGYSIYLNFWKDGYLAGNYYMDIYGMTEDVVLTLDLTPLVMTSAHGKVLDNYGMPVKNAWVELIFAGKEIIDYGGSMLGVPNDPTWGGFDAAYSENQGSGGFAPEAPVGMARGESDSGSPFDNPLMQRYRWENRNRHEGQAMDSEPFSGYYGVSTNDNGEFTIDELPVGAYYTFVTAYKHLSVSGDVEIVEEASANYLEFTIDRVPVGSVKGYVRDENGVLIGNALVNCVQPQIDPFAYTNEDGYFQIDNVPAGDWIVSAFKYGFVTDSKTVTIEQDKAIDVDLAIKSYTPPNVVTVHFTGRVTDGITGEGIEGARMIFTTADNQFFYDATTISNGFYSAELIPTEYNVLIQHPNYMDIYMGFYVDSLYPQFDFSMWSIGGGMGPWGGIMPGWGWSGGMEDDFHGSPTLGGEAPPSWDPDQIFGNRR